MSFETGSLGARLCPDEQASSAASALLEFKACAGCGELFPIRSKLGRSAKWCSDHCRKTTLYGGECEVCGAPTSGDAGGRAKRPRFCVQHGKEHSAAVRHKRYVERRVMVEAMWADGLTAGQIAAELGWNTRRPGTRICQLRRRGYDLPYRRTPEQVARITAGADARLAKARAVYREQVAA